MCNLIACHPELVSGSEQPHFQKISMSFKALKIKRYLNQNNYETIIFVLFLSIVFSLVAPFFIQGDGNIARYAAGGQVFGALATLLAVIIAIHQFKEQNNINSIVEFNKSRSYLLPVPGSLTLNSDLGSEKNYDPDEEIYFNEVFPIFIKNISERTSFDIKIEIDNNLEFNNNIYWEIPLLDSKIVSEMISTAGKTNFHNVVPKNIDDKIYIRLSYYSLPKSVLKEIDMLSSGLHRHVFKIEAIEGKKIIGLNWKNLKEII